MVKDHSDSERERKEGNVLFNDALNTFWGAGRSSEVERLLMVRWIVGSILHGGPIELFLIPASAPQLV